MIEKRSGGESGKLDGGLKTEPACVGERGAGEEEAATRDLSDRARMIRELRESEQKYRGIFDESIAAIYVFDREMHFIDSNQAGLDLLGYTREELLGLRIPDVDADPAAVEPAHDRLLHGERITNFEHRLRRKDGTVITVLNNSRPLTGLDGEVTGLQSTIIDITDRKAAEVDRERLHQQLLQSSKLDALGHLAGGVAHDFNNLLAVILFNAQLGKLDLKPGDPGYDAFLQIEEAALRSKELTMKMLTFARKEELKSRPASINAIIRDLHEMLSRTLMKSIQIDLDLEEQLPDVVVDGNQIQLALLNICTNASDAMPGGGTLRIETRRVTVDEKNRRDFSGVEPGEYIQILTTDTGTGIPEEDIDRIFDPFFTTKAPDRGTGLGLSVVLGTIRNYGGSIDAMSPPGGGTTIRIVLPASGAYFGEAVGSPKKEIVKGSGTILVVDDEEQVLDVVGRILRRAGYSIIEAHGGEEAIERFRKERARIDLVLLDMIMPGKDGKAVYEVLRKIEPGVKVILSSGYTLDGHIGEEMVDGIARYVQKPYGITELCGAIQETLAGS